MVPQDPRNPLRSTLPRYCSMEAGRQLFRSSARFFVFLLKKGASINGGFTFLTHILSYRHGPTDLFSIGASSSATRFYLTKPRARPRREFALPNSLITRRPSILIRGPTSTQYLN